MKSKGYVLNDTQKAKMQAEAAEKLRARAAELNDTGRGIAFVLPVEKVVGVAHFMRLQPEGRVTVTLFLIPLYWHF